MKHVLYLAVGILFCVAAASVFFFFQNPANVAWLISAGVSAIASVILPSILKRKTLEAEAEWRERQRRGEGDPPFSGHREH